MSACFQAGKSRADQRLARCGNTSTASTTSTATINDTPLLEYQRAALAYRHRVAQHDALALIARVGIGAIFFLSGRTRVEGWLISVCCRWRTGPRQRRRAARNSLLRHARLPWRWVAGSRLDRALVATVLIASCARSAWARGVFSIKDGLVATCGGRQLATVGWYTRLRV